MHFIYKFNIYFLSNKIKKSKTEIVQLAYLHRSFCVDYSRSPIPSIMFKDSKEKLNYKQIEIIKTIKNNKEFLINRNLIIPLDYDEYTSHHAWHNFEWTTSPKFLTHDVFSKEKENYRLYSSSMVYDIFSLIVGNGPDQDQDIYFKDYLAGYKDLSKKMYDPTNGLMSDGDITIITDPDEIKKSIIKDKLDLKEILEYYNGKYN
jgi:hypothetical protein